MDLKLIRRDVTSHPGYGAGSGEIVSEEYECPCGKDVVKYEKDDIPGFRDSSTSCNCKERNGKYEFKRGTATERN